MQLVLIIGILIINIITVVLAGWVLINKKSNEYYNKKIILSSNACDLTEGVFGQAIIWVFEVLESLEKKGYTPKDIQFDINAKAYGKIIPGILNPKDNVVGKEVIDMVKYKRDNSAESTNYYKLKSDVFFQKYNKIFEKWFKIPDKISQKIPKFDTNNTLGLHYRGTDKNKDNEQSNPITINEFIIIIKDFISKHKNINTIFACSDEKGFVEKLLSIFPNINILENKQERGSKNEINGFFRTSNNLTQEEKNNRNIDAMLDVLSLSKCGYVLKGSSAMSAFSKILNPSQKIFQVQAMKMPWYPAVGIPPYETDSKQVNEILSKTLKGDKYNG